MNCNTTHYRANSSSVPGDPTLLFASEFTPLGVGGPIAVMFVAAMVCLSVAFLMFLIEVRLATKTLRIGVHKN